MFQRTHLITSFPVTPLLTRVLVGRGSGVLTSFSVTPLLTWVIVGWKDFGVVTLNTKNEIRD